MPKIKYSTKPYKRLTIDDISDEGCMNLFEALLQEIGTEYRLCAIQYKEHPEVEGSKEHYEKCREYILSDFFHDLTGLDGDSIVKSFDREVGLEVV